MEHIILLMPKHGSVTPGTISSSVGKKRRWFSHLNEPLCCSAVQRQGWRHPSPCKDFWSHVNHVLNKDTYKHNVTIQSPWNDIKNALVEHASYKRSSSGCFTAKHQVPLCTGCFQVQTLGVGLENPTWFEATTSEL